MKIRLCLLDTSENLVLPNIRNVKFSFGCEISLSSTFLSKLLEFIGNTEKLKISWFDLSAEHLDIITRKLTKLRELKFDYYIDRKGLQIIQENIEMFNEKPHLFRIDSLTIEKYKKQFFNNDTEEDNPEEQESSGSEI